MLHHELANDATFQQDSVYGAALMFTMNTLTHRRLGPTFQQILIAIVLQECGECLLSVAFVWEKVILIFFTAFQYPSYSQYFWIRHKSIRIFIQLDCCRIFIPFDYQLWQFIRFLSQIHVWECAEDYAREFELYVQSFFAYLVASFVLLFLVVTFI